MNGKSSDTYTLTLTLTGDDARAAADEAGGDQTGATERRTALLAAVRDYGAVLEFVRTETTILTETYDLMESS